MTAEMYLLDTNVISEAARKRPDSGVMDFLSHARESSDGLFLSVLTLGEIYRGIVKLERHGDETQVRKLRQWHGEIHDEFTECVLPIDGDTALLWGAILAATDGTNAIDKLIAATALQYDLILVTRNVGHVRGTGVRWLNPFTGQS